MHVRSSLTNASMKTPCNEAAPCDHCECKEGKRRPDGNEHGTLGES